MLERELSEAKMGRNRDRLVPIGRQRVAHDTPPVARSMDFGAAPLCPEDRAQRVGQMSPWRRHLV
jgi:hypothetical protein